MTDDSLGVRIAVMPTFDCLPVYLAQEHGFFKQKGLDVEVLTYQAQMDCDTALLGGSVNAIVTDLVRAERMISQGADLEYVTSTEASWQLLTSVSSRIRKLHQLDDKMLAMTRFSATHMLSDKLVDSAGLKPERVFRIQVNDVNVRLGMLSAGIMDALLLPEPQATAARNMNAFKLYDTRESECRMGVVAMSKRVANQQQLQAFYEAYNLACDSLNQRGYHFYADFIMQHCQVHKPVIDSLPQIHFQYAEAPRSVDIQRAKQWLVRKSEIREEEQGL
jgi:NitT/TauT family transport system substrate-binding protein